MHATPEPDRPRASAGGVRPEPDRPRTSAGAARPDGWAAALPLVCGVHCLVTPALVSVLPFLELGVRVESVIFLLSAVLVLGVFRQSLPHHGRWAPLPVMVVGLVVWGLSLGGSVGPLTHAWAAGLGGVLTAAGAFWNGWLLHRVHCREEGECLVDGHLHTRADRRPHAGAGGALHAGADSVPPVGSDRTPPAGEAAP